MPRIVLTLFVLLFSVSVAACGGLGGIERTAVPTSSNPTPTPTPTPTPIPGQRLYAVARSNCNPGPCSFTIDVFNLALYTNSTPAFAVSIPAGFSVGNIAIDASGNLAACSFSGNGAILMYAAPLGPSSAPSAIIPGNCGMLAFDGAGNLYDPVQGAGVKVFSPPFISSSVPSRTISSGLSSAVGVAFDAQHNLYVSEAGAVNRIAVFASPYAAMPTYINGNFSALRSIAFDASGNLFASDLGKAGSGMIHVMSPPFSAVSFDITSGINTPQQLAVDNRNDLYVASVASTGTLVMYTGPFSSSSAPAFTLGAHFNSSIGVAVGP